MSSPPASDEPESESTPQPAPVDLTKSQPVGFVIDGFIVGLEEHAEQLDVWKQGHLVRGIPMSWVSPAGTDPVTKAVMGGVGEDVFVLDDTFDAIICSQTCDIGGVPPGDRYPFVLVAPLVHHSTLKGSRAKLALQGKIGYLVPIETPTGSAGGRGDCWYADLRMMVPVSKTLLLSRTPDRGFVSEDRYLQFGEALGQKFRRAATDEVLSKKLPDLLKDFVSSNNPKGQHFSKVEQVRVTIISGERLLPASAQVHIITDQGPLDSADQAKWEKFNDMTKILFEAAGLAWRPHVHHDISGMSARVYRQSVPVPCDLLGSARWW